jgi:hypothetical protein
LDRWAKLKLEPLTVEDESQELSRVGELPELADRTRILNSATADVLHDRFWCALRKDGTRSSLGSGDLTQIGMGSLLGCGGTKKLDPANLSDANSKASPSSVVLASFPTCCFFSGSVGGLAFLSDRSAEGARLAALLAPFPPSFHAGRLVRSIPDVDVPARPSSLSSTQLELREARPPPLNLSSIQF